MMNLGILLAVSGIIFCLGVFGALVHRSMLRILLSVILIFASNVTVIIAFNFFLYSGSAKGYVFAVCVSLFCMMELAAGAGLVMLLQKERQTVLEDKMDLFKG